MELSQFFFIDQDSNLQFLCYLKPHSYFLENKETYIAINILDDDKMIVDTFVLYTIANPKYFNEIKNLSF